VVPIEGSGGRATITTPNAVNSCSSNQKTGTTVCTANNTDVYVIDGTSLITTKTSGGVGTTTFTGGSCTNCGVVVDSVDNIAVIGLSLAADVSTTALSSSGSGFQVLDLASGNFSPPLDSQTFQISESFALDPGRKLVLSSSEEHGGLPTDYQIVKDINNAPALFNFQDAATVFANNSDLDSAAEDCLTGIAMASSEFTRNVFLADLSQATFTPGTGGAPGTWNAPNQIQSLSDVDFGAGITGITVAPGSHLGLLGEEFGGGGFQCFSSRRPAVAVRPRSSIMRSRPCLTIRTTLRGIHSRPSRPDRLQESQLGQGERNSDERCAHVPGGGRSTGAAERSAHGGHAHRESELRPGCPRRGYVRVGSLM
jgi:hypothetical protein